MILSPSLNITSGVSGEACTPPAATPCIQGFASLSSDVAFRRKA